MTAIHAQDLEPFKIYTVKKAAWHTHTLSEDAMVLVVENRDTDAENSPVCPLTSAQRRDIVGLTGVVWPRQRANAAGQAIQDAT